MSHVVHELDAGDDLRVAEHVGEQLACEEVEDADVLVAAAAGEELAAAVERDAQQRTVVAHRAAVARLLLAVL